VLIHVNSLNIGGHLMLPEKSLLQLGQRSI